MEGAVHQPSLYNHTERRVAAEKKPTDPAVYNNLGVAYEIKGDYETAEKNYQKALSLKPSEALYMQQHNHGEKIRSQAKRLQALE